MSDEIFDNPLADDNLPGFVQESPEEASEEPKSEETSTQPILDSQPQAEPVEAQQAAEEQQAKAWAGKYRSPEELEKGYREMRDLQRRTAERAKAYEQANLEVQARASQMEEALRRAIPIVQQAMAQNRAQQEADPYGEPKDAPPPTYTPEQIQQQVDYRMAQQVRQMQQQQQRAWAQQQEYNVAAQAMQSFFADHPEVEQGGTTDEDIASTIVALNEAWDDSEVDLASRDALEIAYEASQRPALRQVLEMNPRFFDSDEGLALARQQAAQLESSPVEATQTGQRTSSPRSNTPVVERGSSQTPEQAILDEFEQAVAEYKKANNRGSDVFFGG